MGEGQWPARVDIKARAHQTQKNKHGDADAVGAIVHRGLAAGRSTRSSIRKGTPGLDPWIQGAGRRKVAWGVLSTRVVPKWRYLHLGRYESGVEAALSTRVVRKPRYLQHMLCIGAGGRRPEWPQSTLAT